MARADLAKRGYRPSSVRLHYPDTPEGRLQLASRCQILQAEMLAWASRGGASAPGYDGTIKSLSSLFQVNDDSPFHSMKWNSRDNFLKSLKVIEQTVGTRQIGKLLGPDYKRWHASWGLPKEDNKPPRPWRAKHAIDAVRQLIGYGVTLGYEDCFRADAILSKIRFKTPPARKSVLTDEHVMAVRSKAHELGRNSIALATALQFSLTMRQKDVIGEWEPVSSVEGGIRHKDTIWVNGHVKTGFEVEHDLKLHPMIMEEIALVPSEKRVGPMIIAETTGEPYKHRTFTQQWRVVAKKAGVPNKVWNMDARAGGITEAYDLGAAETDVMKAAGHKNRQTSARYNRGTLEQTSRVAKTRMTKRTGNTE